MIPAVIKSSLILLMTLGIARILSRQSAAVRHMILAVGLLAALSVPLASPLLPSWHPLNFGTEGVRPPVETRVIDSMLTSSREGSDPFAPNLPPKVPWTAANIMFTAWLAGFAIALAVFLAGAARLAWLVFRAEPIASERWLRIAGEVSRAFNLNRGIRLLQNPQSSTLGTWGILRGRILVPRDAESWSEERVRIVLAHELAHIKRFDWIIQIIAESARAIYWFNPLFWIACKRLRQESEQSCDDAVLNLGIDGQTYAAHLLELARTLKDPQRAWSPMLAMAQLPHLERRFVAMLNPSLNHRRPNALTLVVVALVAICLTLPLAAMQTVEPAAPALPSISAPEFAKPAAAPAPAAPERAAVVAAKMRATTMPSPGRAPLQEGLGSILGTIYDATSAAIPGATVTLSNLDAKSTVPIISSETGSFEFTKLPAGRYLFEVRLPGFQTFTSRLIEIQGTQKLQHDVTLTVGSVAQRVEVQAVGTRKPAPPSNAGTPRRIRVGGNVQAPNLISQVKPIYPQSARDAGVEGTVRLQGIIGTNGSVLGLQVLNEGQVDPELGNAARGAVSQWRYRPTLLNGVPVEVLTTIEVDFKLTQ